MQALKTYRDGLRILIDFAAAHMPADKENQMRDALAALDEHVDAGGDDGALFMLEELDLV